MGAYNIVPLTAVVGHFEEWTRRMEWFLESVEFMMRGGREKTPCTGAMIIDRLRSAMKTGYMDIEEAAIDLVTVAETAWLKQVSAWILYGRLPSFGREDFFVQEIEGQVSLLTHGQLSRLLIDLRNSRSRRNYFLHLSQLPQLLRCCSSAVH